MSRSTPRSALALAVTAAIVGGSCKEAKELLTGSGSGSPSEDLYGAYRKQVQAAGPLTDEMVVRYVKTYRALRKQGISLARTLAREGSGASQPTGIDKATRAGGFASTADFVRVNAKIAWAWNVSQGKLGLARHDKLQAWSQRELSKGEAQLESALADPQVPASTKRELRKTLAQLRAGRAESAQTYARQRKLADAVVRWVTPLTNEHDLAVISRHEAELMEVFTGLSATQLEAIRQATLKQLDALPR